MRDYINKHHVVNVIFTIPHGRGGTAISYILGRAVWGNLLDIIDCISNSNGGGAEQNSTVQYRLQTLHDPSSS